MQEALYKQLSSEEEKLRYDLLQKKKVLQSLEIDRENVGVELYESQQKLVKLQNTIEIDQITSRNICIEKDNLLSQKKIFEKDFVQSRNDNIDFEENYKRLLDELSIQNNNFIKIEEYLDQLKTEKNIIKRENFKNEEIITIEERRKDRQDYLINSLSEENKQKIELKNVLKLKIETQQSHKEYLSSFLNETKSEIDKLSLTQRNLLMVLKRSIIDLDEKSKGIDLAKEVLKMEKEKLIAVKARFIGIRNEKIASQKTYADYEMLQQKLNSTLRVIEKEKSNLSLKKERVLVKLDILQKALNSTEEELSIFALKQNKIRNSIVSSEKTLTKLHNEVKKILQDILQKSTDSKTSSKLQKNTKIKILNISIKDRETEQDIEGLENEIARLRLDILNTEITISGLSNSRNIIHEEKQKHEKELIYNENEIKINNDIQDKKMLEVAKYNTEYHKIRHKLLLKTSAPAEAALLTLQQQLNQIKKARKSIEGEFIRNQTSNIEKEIDISAILNETSQLTQKVNIIGRKQQRLNVEYKEEEKETKGLKLSIKNIENEMNRLNDLLAQFTEKNDELRGKNTSQQADFSEKLKIFESEAARLELEIDRLKEKKAELIQEIIETEKKGLLWERKIELEKEMQTTLDPNVGQTEIVKLCKEHHLLSLDLDKIKKEQEFYASEVERAVQKRDYIANKYHQKENSQPNIIKANYFKNFGENSNIIGGINTASRSSFTCNIKVLKSSIKTSKRILDDLQKTIKLKLQKFSEINENHEQLTKEIDNLKTDIKLKKENLLGLKLTKLVTILEVLKYQQGSIATEKIIKKEGFKKIGTSKLEAFNVISNEFNQFYLIIFETVKNDQSISFSQNYIKEFMKIQNSA